MLATTQVVVVGVGSQTRDFGRGTDGRAAPAFSWGVSLPYAVVVPHSNHVLEIVPFGVISAESRALFAPTSSGTFVVTVGGSAGVVWFVWSFARGGPEQVRRDEPVVVTACRARRR